MTSLGDDQKIDRCLSVVLKAKILGFSTHLTLQSPLSVLCGMYWTRGELLVPVSQSATADWDLTERACGSAADQWRYIVL